MSIEDAALAVLRCVQTSARDTGNPMFDHTPMHDVCKVLLRTTQFRDLEEALRRQPKALD